MVNIRKSLFFNPDGNDKGVFPELKTLQTKSKEFLDNHESNPKFPSTGLSKDDHFPKSQMYSERGNFSTSSYDKHSIPIFLQKIRFSEGVPLQLVKLNQIMY